MSYNDAALWGCGIPQWMIMDGGRDIVTDSDDRKRAIAKIAEMVRFKRMFSDIGRFRHEHGRNIHLPNELWRELQAYRAMLPYTVETSRRKEIERMDDQRKKRKAARRASRNITTRERLAKKHTLKKARQGELPRFNPDLGGYTDEGMDYMDPEELAEMYDAYSQSQSKGRKRERAKKNTGIKTLFRGMKQSPVYKKLLAATKSHWYDDTDSAMRAALKRVISSPAKLAELYYKWAAVGEKEFADYLINTPNYEDIAGAMLDNDMFAPETISQLKQALADELEGGIDQLYL